MKMVKEHHYISHHNLFFQMDYNMAKYATGKRSLAISDRSGQAFPYQEMVKRMEWFFCAYL